MLLFSTKDCLMTGVASGDHIVVFADEVMFDEIIAIGLRLAEGQGAATEPTECCFSNLGTDSFGMQLDGRDVYAAMLALACMLRGMPLVNISA